MTMTMLFYRDLPGKNFCQKFKLKLRHQVVEAEAVEAGAIQCRFHIPARNLTEKRAVKKDRGD